MDYLTGNNLEMPFLYVFSLTVLLLVLCLKPVGTIKQGKEKISWVRTEF